MDTPLLLAAKVAASAGIGMLIGLEREWARKEAGVRSFSIAALLGTLSWLVAPVLAFIEVGVILAVILLVNIYSFVKEEHPLEITTSLALAVTNVLGILVGDNAFFLAFACAIVITALLSWKTELVSFTSKLTVAEIRGALLLAFIAAVVFPLLPDQFIDPWKLINPHAIWLTVLIVSGVNFVNYVLLRQLGARGMRYSAVLGGLVNSAAISVILGEQIKGEPETAASVPANFLLADLAMIFRNAVLVLIFSSFSIGEGAATLIVLGPMMLAAAMVLLVILRSAKQQQQAPEHTPFRSPLDLRYVLAFAALFLLLTALSGLGERFFGALGFLVVVVLGALASAASSAVLVGTGIHMHHINAGSAALAIFLASVMGLVENIVIFYAVTRERGISSRLALLSLPVVLVGVAALILAWILGWW